MAIGVLGSGVTPGNNSDITIYTVPANVSHAVVHITICPRSPGAAYASNLQAGSCVLVDGFTVLGPAMFYLPSTSTVGGNDQYFTTNSVSLILGPGQKVQGRATGSSSIITMDVIVSGYEVP